MTEINDKYLKMPEVNTYHGELLKTTRCLGWKQKVQH